MSDCVIAYNGYLMLAPQGFDCTYTIITPSELEMLRNQSLGSVTIDPEIYTTVSGYLLLSMLSGHILGRIVKTLGRG
ncbi:TPA: hypothetical protein ACGU7N_002929 [Vibrio vulnificus]|uniref:hypothetical protein n=2 Tax=Vibrio vulnificus TaxID=672 RepID=UPI0021DA4626|nr:hypothetical protein [Vibrio vulnificus]MCU8302213.1 hypothetical protein [Vibrio vulnificus]MDK2648027.1 hypothetical protein [Vibrio vulnificus]MDK2665660.1 hypothetical protein [Vibrio vulnificus]MDK2691731.1 hypothetical protein [Vibrio vulnificus]